jgi:excisionase family DNA binding protein
MALTNVRKARWNNSVPKGSRLPPPDTTGPADKILTFSQAAKRFGIPLPTLRRLARDGTLWATAMKNGEVGLRESEVRRFIDRFEKPPQKGE